MEDQYYSMWRGYILDDIRAGKARDIPGENDWKKAFWAQKGFQSSTPSAIAERAGGARAHREFVEAYRYAMMLSDEYPSNPVFLLALAASGIRRKPQGRTHSWGGGY